MPVYYLKAIRKISPLLIHIGQYPLVLSWLRPWTFSLETDMLPYGTQIKVSTQFQGEGSSHELAALLLSECIQYSLYTLKKPIYALYLDAKSAFDVVQRELLIKNLFHIQGASQSLIYIDRRLAGRETVVEWDGQLMGPIDDEQGLEQGGVSSSDFYKIFAQEQLLLAQNSKLGIKLPTETISAIGEADDTVLLANSIDDLYLLLELTNSFSLKYRVDLCAEKTKLQIFKPKGRFDWTNGNLHNPIVINGKPIPFSATAEHVGIVRSVDGNGPALAVRFTAHRKALSSILNIGISNQHRANPASSLKIEELYGTPVLLSGLAALVLKKAELIMLDKHYSSVLGGLLKLHDKTPRCVIHFLGGSLPASALLHIRQLCLFAMICRLRGNILHLYASNYFSSRPLKKSSWFHQINLLCELYLLPDPLKLLTDPLEKYAFK